MEVEEEVEVEVEGDNKCLNRSRKNIYLVLAYNISIIQSLLLMEIHFKLTTFV